MQEVQAVLDQFLEIPGVQGAVLFGQDGFVIDASVSHELDAEAIAALAAGIYGALEGLSSELALEGLTTAMLEFKRAVVFLTRPSATTYLAVIAEQGAAPGAIRYHLRKQLEPLQQIL